MVCSSAAYSTRPANDDSPIEHLTRLTKLIKKPLFSGRRFSHPALSAVHVMAVIDCARALLLD